MCWCSDFTNMIPPYIVSFFLQEVLAKTQEKAASSLTEVSWLGKKLPVRSEKLRVSLIKLQQFEGQLSRVQTSEEKMDVYEKLLMECQDAMQIVRDEIAAEKVRKIRRVIVHIKAEKRINYPLVLGIFADVLSFVTVQVCSLYPLRLSQTRSRQ